MGGEAINSRADKSYAVTCMCDTVMMKPLFCTLPKKLLKKAKFELNCVGKM